ncbi:uncharacterized protein LOC121731289 [Aricia agestis]|uniref:uncharacterized protein LOC121731289 n=1 Tax=Aricia agestis TaxID=91739 RepID=UPI001C2091AC|nr:uncharacterized protein LOC121731289 [Aricia agestis]
MFAKVHNCIHQKDLQELRNNTMNSTVECPYKSSKYNEIRRKWKNNSDNKKKLIDNKKQDYKNAEKIAETSNQAPYNTNDKNIKGSDFKIKPSLIPRPISKKATLNTKESNASISIRIQNLVQEIHHLKITQDVFETEVQRVDLTRPIPNIDSEIDLQNNNIFIDQEFVISEMCEINYDGNANEDLKESNIEHDLTSVVIKQTKENILDDTKDEIDGLPKPLESTNISDESEASKVVIDVINHTLDEYVKKKLADDVINHNNDTTASKIETPKKKSIHLWDSRGRCKRCHVYKIGHKPRKGRLMLMMRMSIGRICKQRLYEAWRKTADHFIPRPRFKLPKSSIMIHIEKSLVWTKDIPRSNTDLDTAKEAEIENWSLKPDSIKNDTEPTQTSKHSLNNGGNPKVGPSIFRLPDPRTEDTELPVPTRTVVCTNQSSVFEVTQGFTDPLITYQDNDTQTIKSSNKTIGVFAMEQILLNEKSNYVTETTVPCRRLENTLVTARGTILTCTGTRITSLSPVASVYHLQQTLDTTGLSAWFTRKDDQNPTTVQRVCCFKDVCLGFQDLRQDQSTSYQRSLLDIKDNTTSTSTSGLRVVKSVCLSEVFNVVETNEVHCFTQYNEYSPELALLSRSELMSVRLLDSVREMAIEAKPLTCDTQINEFISSKSAEVVTTLPITEDKSISTLDFGIEKDTQYEVLEATANLRQKGGRSPADFVISSNLNAQKWMDGYKNNPKSLNLSQVTVNELLERAFTTSTSRAPGVPQNAFSCVAMEKEDSSASKTDIITNSAKTSQDPFRNVSNVTTKDNISGPAKRSSKSSINIVLKLSRRHKRDCVISINFDAQNAQHTKRK